MPFLPETALQDLVDWGRDLTERKAFVLHRGLSLVGRAAKVWPAGEYVGKNGTAVTAPVLQLEDGNAFVLREDETGEIVEVTPAEAEVYVQLVADMSAVIAGAAVVMKERGTALDRMPVVVGLVRSALTIQLRALRTGG